MSELYKLPAGWEWKDYKKVFENISSKPFQIPKSEYLDNGSFPVVDQSKDFIVGYSSDETKLHENKDKCVIFGDHTRQIKFVDFPFVIGADGTKILKSKNDDDIKFLYYQLLSKNIKSLGYSRHFKLVKEFRFAIPKLTEQKRIVAKLDSLFEKIDKAIELHQQNITNANILMASTLDKTFKKLEGEYGNKTLSDSVENPKKDIVDGPFGSNLKATEYIQKGVPIIRIQNIQRLEFINKDIKFVSEEKAEFLKRHSFIASDIVITKLGEPLGKSCIVPDNLERGIIVADIIRVRVDSSKSKNKYIMYAINSAIAINQFSENSMGSTRQRVKLSIVRDLKIPLPPLPIQQQTVEYLDSIATKVDKIKQLNEQKLENLKALKASILDKAFRGEL
ncbi:restriction endonuclease subunit S [Francisella sp. 19X1-34]|uniref:restriction endonuclease subunit S n=1 Tax=Francisella sp. 19X1-34 TaxID=3087177 RepID=UPI003FA5AF0C